MISQILGDVERARNIRSIQVPYAPIRDLNSETDFEFIPVELFISPFTTISLMSLVSLMF